MSDYLSPVSATETSRRCYPVEYKRQVVQESMVSGASIARGSRLPTSSLAKISGGQDGATGDIELTFSTARVVIRGAPDQATLRCVIDALRE